jgi:hypothetical protein
MLIFSLVTFFLRNHFWCVCIFSKIFWFTIFDEIVLGCGARGSEQVGTLGHVSVQGRRKLHQRLHDFLQVLQLFAGEYQP